MTPKRAILLGELMGELADDPKGFIPNEVWNAAQRAFALPYIELAIVRRNPEDKVQILLMHRTDKYWDGWHIPGGLWRTRHTLEEGISSLARLELGDEPKLTLLAKGGWEKWHDHPSGRPIAHIVICSGTSIIETAAMKWFDTVPEDMIEDDGHHATYIRQVLEQAEFLV